MVIGFAGSANLGYAGGDYLLGSRGSTWILSVVVVGISGPMSMITILGDWSRYVSPTRYPARKGFDEFYGYGRLNAYKAVSAAAHGTIPPEAEITAPDWFQQIDPAQSSLALSGASGSSLTSSE